MRFMKNRGIVDPEKYKYAVLVACFFAFMFDNADMLVTSIGLPLLLDVFDITVAEGGLIATSMLVGAAIGSWFWGPFADRRGSRCAYIVCLTCYTVFTVSCALCHTLVPFLVLRFLCGLALGGAWTIGVAYLSDFFPEAQRGRAVGAVQSSAAVGMLFIVFIMKYLVPIFTWRALFYSALLAVPLILFFVWLPDSPVWLANRRKAVQRVTAGDVKKRPGDPDSASGLVALFRVPRYRRALLLAAALVIGIQVGNWGATSWIPTYLVQERGLSNDAMADVVAAMYIGAFVGYWVLGWMADRWGRRKTYLFISAYTFLATFAYMNFATDATAMLFAAIFGFGSLGMFGPLGAFVSESIPAEARGSGLGFVWGSGRLVAASVPVILGSLATVASLQLCIMLASTAYILCFAASVLMHETKGHAEPEMSVGVRDADMLSEAI